MIAWKKTCLTGRVLQAQTRAHSSWRRAKNVEAESVKTAFMNVNPVVDLVTVFIAVIARTAKSVQVVEGLCA